MEPFRRFIVGASLKFCPVSQTGADTRPERGPRSFRKLLATETRSSFRPRSARARFDDGVKEPCNQQSPTTYSPHLPPSRRRRHHRRHPPINCRQQTNAFPFSSTHTIPTCPHTRLRPSTATIPSSPPKRKPLPAPRPRPSALPPARPCATPAPGLGKRHSWACRLDGGPCRRRRDCRWRTRRAVWTRHCQRPCSCRSGTEGARRRRHCFPLAGGTFDFAMSVLFPTAANFGAMRKSALLFWAASGRRFRCVLRRRGGSRGLHHCHPLV